MPTFLDPELFKVVKLTNASLDGSPAIDLQQYLRHPWNYLLLESDLAVTAIAHYHLRFDGTDAEDPSQLPSGTRVNGIVASINSANSSPILFSKPWAGPVTITVNGAAAGGGNLYITHGVVETSQVQVFPIPGIGLNRAGG